MWNGGADSNSKVLVGDLATLFSFFFITQGGGCALRCVCV